MWNDILFYAAVGFAAQIVDGALGMAYGLIATTVLLSFGVTPSVASASVHAAEVFTTGASGLAHWRLGNVDTALLRSLALPGMIGGAIGAYVLTAVPTAVIHPVVSVYLLIMGCVILWRAAAARTRRREGEPPRYVGPLGFAGGFLDAIGGGGWGPIVNSTLIGQGATPRFSIGSVSLSEFFVTVTIAGTFVLTIGLELWPIILGLVVGGVIAAPLAAYLAVYVPERALMVLVGGLIMLLSWRGMAQALGWLR